MGAELHTSCVSNVSMGAELHTSCVSMGAELQCKSEQSYTCYSVAFSPQILPAATLTQTTTSEGVRSIYLKKIYILMNLTSRVCDSMKGIFD